MRLFGAFASLLAASLVQASSSDIQATIVSATGETQQESSGAYQSLKDGDNVTSATFSSIDHGQAMIDWIRSHGGFVHPSLFVGPVIMDGSEVDESHNFNNTPYGLFAREPLKAGETILRIPYELTIHTHADGKFDQCETARKLHREMKLGAESFYGPYIQYLLETQTKGQVPSQWSKEGQTLLHTMLRHETTDDDGNSLALPPYDVTTWEYLERCNPSPEEEFALELLRYRGWDEVLIPVYDMMMHSNDPKKLNTVSSKIMRNVDKEPIVVNTTLDVPAGGLLYCSYNYYVGSKNLANYYGTSGLLIDFGFVESLPQRWFIDEYKYFYDGEEDEENGRTDDDISIVFELSRGNDGSVVVTWLEDWMEEDDIEFARGALQYLKAFDKERLQVRPEGIPEREWNTIKEYNNALSFALESALHAHFYDPLKLGDDDKYTINEEIYSEDRHYTCDHFKTHAFPGHKTLEWVVSHYQRLEFDVHPKTRETCFWLDMYVQQCTSYRPHYHEVAIHYTARYLDKVQRIAWIGGGDSMLLHDALKYPTLELALGLELDQKVTRYNYKYMGSQPHYDNEKVQWWYGDATKSLLMLPQDYFGSFDMVVIDLSDTAMQLSVTSDLSIFAALSLLLRPGGIMVKNEEYLEQFSRVFDYTIQAHFYDVPIVCSQSFILGSYGTDFLATEPKDHHPSDLMFVNKRPDIESRFGIWHDYRRNITRTNAHCQEPGADDHLTNTVVQTTSPGILMVVEAENVTASLVSTSHVRDLLAKALEQEANVKVTGSVAQEESGIIGLSLNTGYVIARTFPKYNYCSFDIHFWGQFELQERAKAAMIASIGGGKAPKSVSSYRIVAGGMFGVDSWKSDAKMQGPRKVHECERRPDAPRGPFTDQKAVDQITSDFLNSLVDSKSIDIMVVCGEKTSKCISSDGLKKIANINKLHEVRACGKAGDFISMEKCEADVLENLKRFAMTTKGFSGFHAMLVDPDAPLEILQVILNLFKTMKIWKSFTQKDNFLIIANNLDTSRLATRRAFLDRIRKETTDPAHRAEVLFNSTDSSMEAGVFLYGATDAFEKFTNVVAKIESATGLVAEVRNIGGGMFQYQHNFDPALVYKHSDFDMNDALAQWESQRPVGFQTIFQFVKLTPEEQLDVHDKVMILYPDDGQWYPGKIVWVHPADDTVDVRYDSGDIGKGISTSLVKKDASNVVTKEESVSKDAGSLSGERIRDALTNALMEVKFEGMDKANIQHYHGPGEGSMTMAYWSGGNAVALWDGRSHIDLNLFTYSEDAKVADAVQEQFKKIIPFLKTALRDEQPRGFGRVVNYLRDVDEYKGYLPVWADHFSDKGAKQQGATA